MLTCCTWWMLEHCCTIFCFQVLIIIHEPAWTYPMTGAVSELFMTPCDLFLLQAVLQTMSYWVHRIMNSWTRNLLISHKFEIRQSDIHSPFYRHCVSILKPFWTIPRNYGTKTQTILVEKRYRPETFSNQVANALQVHCPVLQYLPSNVRILPLRIAILDNQNTITHKIKFS